MGIRSAGEAFLLKKRIATSWEELRALEGFLADVDRKEIVQGKIVGEYAMPSAAPMQPCGIRQCRTKHRKGFIVELTSHAVSHTGGHCGKKHFGTAAWRERLRSYRDAKQAEAKATALEEVRERAEKVLGTKIVPPPQYDSANKMLAVFDKLPSELRDSIVAKAQDRDSSIAFFRAPTKKEIDNAKFLGERAPTQIRQVIGNIAGLSALLRSSRADYLYEVEIPARLKVVQSSMDGDADDLFDALRKFDVAVQLLNDSIFEAHLFFTDLNFAQFSNLGAVKRLGITSVNIEFEPNFKILLR